MEPNETMVNEENLDEGLDNEFMAEIEGETNNPDEASIESFTETADDVKDEDKATEDNQSTTGKKNGEPGYVKKRVNEAVERARAEMQADFNKRLQEEIDKQMAPFRERMLNDEAKDLVRQGEFKSIERAKEYLRLKNGLPVPEGKQEQPRNEQGQFASREPKEDPTDWVKVDILAKQADKVRAKTGLDVVAELEGNPDIRRAVLSGEMDFYEVAEQMRQRSEKRKPPTPMRSPNGATSEGRNRIEELSDAAFRRMEKAIAEGKRVTLKQ